MTPARRPRVAVNRRDVLQEHPNGMQTIDSPHETLVVGIWIPDDRVINVIT